MKRFVCWILMLTVLFSVASATEAYPSGYSKTVEVKVREVDVSGLLMGSAAEIEGTLYPSGMQLPTKYLDAAILFPTDKVKVSGTTYLFLTTNWPNPEKEYTYAEILAAQMWVDVWFRVNYLSGPRESVDTRAVSSWIEDNNIMFSGASKTVEVGDDGKFIEVLRELYVASSELEVAFHTRGIDFRWDDFTDENRSSADYQQTSSLFWARRGEWFDLLGLAFTDCVADWSFDQVIGKVAAGTETDEGGAFAGSEIAPPEPPPQNSAGLPVDDPEPSDSGSEYLKTPATGESSYVNNFNPGIGGFTAFEHKNGWRDILSGACIVVVLVFTLTALVIQAIRDRDDPTKGKRRW